MDSIVQSKGIVPRGISYSSELPDCGNESPVDTLLVGLKEITQDNFLSAVFVLGKNSFHVHLRTILECKLSLEVCLLILCFID